MPKWRNKKIQTRLSTKKVVQSKVPVVAQHSPRERQSVQESALNESKRKRRRRKGRRNAIESGKSIRRRENEKLREVLLSPRNQRMYQPLLSRQSFNQFRRILMRLLRAANRKRDSHKKIRSLQIRAVRIWLLRLQEMVPSPLRIRMIILI